MDAVTSKVVVAHITKVEGIVFVKSPDGTMRIIKVGDPLYKGDVIITDPGSRAEFENLNGNQTSVAERQTVMLDDEVAGAATAADSAVAAMEPAEVTQVIQALNTGEDINIVLDETAAGMVGSGVEQGHFVVKVQRANIGYTPEVDVELGTNTGNPVELERIIERIDALGKRVYVNPGNMLAYGDVENEDILAGQKPAPTPPAPPGNNPPVAVADTGATAETVVLTVTAANGVLANDIDPDVGDTHTVSAINGAAANVGAAVAGNNGGTFTVAADGSYTFDPGTAFNYLAAGQTATTSITYTNTDNSGASSSSTLTVTVTGTNAAPVITSAAQAGAVVEDGTLTAGGALTFTDIDVSDTHTATVTAAATNTTALGTLALGAMTDTTNGVGGLQPWSYTLNNAAAQYLAAGQTVTEVYTITVDDGNGGTATQDVTITITGTNDVPVITSAAQAGAVVEDGVLTASGAATFADVDVNDTHTTTVTVSTANTTALGTLSLGAMTDTANGVGGSQAWTYTLDNAAAQYLAAGQTVTEVYTITVADGNGGTATQDVTITIAGTNDAPVITSTVQAGAVVEDSVLTANGTVTFTDIDVSDTHTSTVTAAATNTTALGTLTMGAMTDTTNGIGGAQAWTYTLDNAAAQYLAAGQTVTEVYTVTVSDGKGGTVTQDVTITITGTNDIPVIGGVNTGSVTENVNVDAAGNLVTGGALAISDADAGQSSFQAQAATAGTYGTFTVDAAGNWTYTAANNNPTIIGLGAGQSLTENFIVTSMDGTGTTTVTVTIYGVNSIPTIGGVTTGAVTEDVAVDAAGNLVTGAALTITDPDAGQSSFAPQANTPGAYGMFTIDAAGNWTYTAANNDPAIQALGQGQTLTETFTVVSMDGSVSQTITVTINGTNDPAVIGGVTTGAVTEDVAVDAAGSLIASGALTITDIDAGQSSFTPQAGTAGTYGTFTIDAAGNWTYTAANNNPTIQALGQGQTLTETFTVTSVDGTAQTITVTINGTNDVPTIGGVATGAVTEDVAVDAAGNLVANGALTITDVDAGQSSFQAQAATAGTYGTFAIDATGNWIYTAGNAQAAIQSLAVGQTLTETFTVTSMDGSASQMVTVTITGTNDVPVITSAAQAGAVVEDTTANATGAVTFSDVDVNDTHTATVTASAANTTAYGALTLGAMTDTTNGTGGSQAWTYTLDNTLAGVQALAAGQTVTEVYTITVDDGNGGTATQDVTVTITGTNDVPVIDANAAAVVSETGLPNGIPLPGVTSATTVTGQYLFHDVDSTTFTFTVTEPITPVTSGGTTLTWTGGTNGTPLIGSANGAEVVRVAMDNTGAYTVTLSGPIDHGGLASNNLDFGVAISDGAATTTGAFTVTVMDGSPVAGNMTHGVIETNGPTGQVNLMIVIDKSASMAELSGIQKVDANGNLMFDAAGNPIFMTRFEAAQAAAIKLINDYVAQYGAGNVAVNLMDFSSGSSTNYLLGYWMTPDQALAKMNTYAGITPLGGTNYDTALADTMAAFDATNMFAPQGVKFTGATNNAIYFLSDGLPTAANGDTTTLTGFNTTGNAGSDVMTATTTTQYPDVGIQTAEEGTWTAFLAGANKDGNTVNAYALSMGTAGATYNPAGLDPVPNLNPIAYDGRTPPTNTNGQVITDLNMLPMLSSPLPVNGNILADNAAYAQGGFGADGGTYTSFTIDGVTYNNVGTASAGTAGTWDAATNTWTVNTGAGGTLVMDMATGAYTYTPIPTMNNTQTVTENIGFTLTDNDGNAVAGTYRLSVSYSGIVNGTAGDDVMIGSAGNDTIIASDGNDVIYGGLGNDTMTGGLGADVFKWGINDHGAAGTPQVDTITDFDTTANSDSLNLRDLLQGESAAAGNLDQYLHFEQVGTDTVVHVSSTGGFAAGGTPGAAYNAAAEDQTIVLQGVDMIGVSTTDQQIVQDMMTKGKLVTD